MDDVLIVDIDNNKLNYSSPELEKDLDLLPLTISLKLQSGVSKVVKQVQAQHKKKKRQQRNTTSWDSDNKRSFSGGEYKADFIRFVLRFYGSTIAQLQRMLLR